MLILASKSPRRKELLKKLVDNFEIIVSNVDESKVKATIDLIPLETSKLKANAVKKLYPNDEILACDTVVIINNEILGKPKDKVDAIRMLTLLSGNKHEVISGYTFLGNDKEVFRSVSTTVYFRKLTQEEILDYIASGSPFDKAGSYGIQDEKYHLVDHIDGSYDNVMGLPTEDIKENVFKN